jgi:hypothetical protein
MGDLADDAGSYVGRSSKSLILGDWTDEKPTGLSIGAGIGLGVLGVDLPMDVRDLSHTLTHREWTYKWGETLAYNSIGLIPLIGVLKNLKNAKRLKNLDDAGELAKRSDDATDAAGDAGRRGVGADEAAPPVAPNTGSPKVDLTDPKARKHILEGDGPSSGGHRPGTGKPGKSEFPADWTDEKILDSISDAATDPSVKWSKPDKRGYITGSITIDGIDIKVVFDTKNNRIVSGYPTNVDRNP